jgi:hypothetical protein
MSIHVSSQVQMQDLRCNVENGVSWIGSQLTLTFVAEDSARQWLLECNKFWCACPLHKLNVSCPSSCGFSFTLFDAFLAFVVTLDSMALELQPGHRCTSLFWSINFSSHHSLSVFRYFPKLQLTIPLGEDSNLHLSPFYHLALVITSRIFD